MTSSPKDYYYILGIKPGATLQEIKVAYRKLSMKFHPDKNYSDPFFEARFKEIQEAYETLSDMGKRSAYDSFRLNQAYEQDQAWRKEQELREREEAIRAKEDQLRREGLHTGFQHTMKPDWLATLRDFGMETYKFWLSGRMNQIHPGWQEGARKQGKGTIVQQVVSLVSPLFAAYELPVFAGEAFVECCNDREETYPNVTGTWPSDNNSTLPYMLTTYRLIFVSPSGVLTIVPLKEIATYNEIAHYWDVEVVMTGRFGRICFKSKKNWTFESKPCPAQFWPRSELVSGLISLRAWDNLSVDAREFLGQATIPITRRQ